MSEKRMFDFELVASQYNIDKNLLDEILSDLREEFPGDELMVELHALRIIKNMSISALFDNRTPELQHLTKLF